MSKNPLKSRITIYFENSTSNLAKKQDDLRKYDFEGNIDTLVSNGNYWINTENASGTMPNNGYFQLQVNSDGYNHIQRAFLYIDNVQPPYICQDAYEW